MEPNAVERIVEAHKDSHGAILAMLTEIQTRCGYLPEEALRRLAALTGRSLTDIYAVATFYRAFSLTPRGKHLVSVCLGTACHVRGGQRIADEFSTRLGITPGQTTADKEFSLETVNCLGACALGPTVVADGRYFRHVTTADVPHIIEQARKGFRRTGGGRDEREFPLAVECPRCGRTLMDSAHKLEGSPAIRLAAEHAGKKGSLAIACLYGNGTARCTLDVPLGALTALSCPHCGASLDGDSECPECGVKMAAMAVDGQAVLHVCPRHGCAGHRLDLTSGPARAGAAKGRKVTTRARRAGKTAPRKGRRPR